MENQKPDLPQRDLNKNNDNLKHIICINLALKHINVIGISLLTYQI